MIADDVALQHDLVLLNHPCVIAVRLLHDGEQVVLDGFRPLLRREVLLRHAHLLCHRNDLHEFR